MNRQKLGSRLAFAVHEGHLTTFGLEILMDAFDPKDLHVIGRFYKAANADLEEMKARRDGRKQQNRWT